MNRGLLFGLSALSWLAACAPATKPERPTVPPSRGPTATVGVVEMITPARLVPELDVAHLHAAFVERGRAKYLVGGMRVLRHEDGRVERAAERFRGDNVQTMPLPDRLGKGYVYYQSDNQGTQLWRSDDWTAKLVPLAHLGPTVSEVIVGFDRLYLRTNTNRLMALAASDGAVLPLSQLPVASAHGAMAFADGWRAVVDTDLRGPMASFDAGATWTPIGVAGTVVSAGLHAGDPVLYVDNGAYAVDARGNVQLVEIGDEGVDDGEVDESDTETRASHPLGDRPLRLAIERGVPDTSVSALAIHRGALVRVGLPHAEVLAVDPKAISERDAHCTGARVGRGIGFVCGAPRGDTVIHRFEPPLGISEVARFVGPRFVSASGNGALVVRGRCGANVEAKGTRAYCVVDDKGALREIAVRGELGAERVVALSDGRIVVLVPPRPGQAGKLNIITGGKLSAHPLELPHGEGKAVKVAERGLWLDGFEQRGRDAIGGWVEAGGPTVGVTVKLDGTVKLGEVYDEGGELLFSGRFAMAVHHSDGARESVDGGKRWRSLELPRLPESAGDAKTRGCSPVGCALRGWLRVGWGPTAVEHDLEVVDAPEAAGVTAKAATPMHIACTVTGRDGDAVPSSRLGSWASFLGSPPPKLGNDEIGVDRPPQSFVEIPAHVYSWGPKGADWTRAGWWQIRFEDRFDLDAPVRSSAPTRPAWNDEVTALESIGSTLRGSYLRWDALLEASGQAAVVSHCTGGVCEPYAVAEGRPILALSHAQGGSGIFKKPLAYGVARVGDVWYLLSTESAALTLWRADLGVLRQAASFRRLDARHYPVSGVPKLVRRARGSDLGLLVQVPADLSSGDPVADWVVLPIDTSAGTLGEPVSLGKSDLGGVVPPPCQAHSDGWLLETRLPVATVVDLVNASGHIDEVELRLRIDPGNVCVEAMAAKASRGFSRSDDGTLNAAKIEPDGSTSIPLGAKERYAEARWKLACRPR